MIFTKTDKALIDRAARYLRGEAAKLEKQFPVFSATKEGRRAKDEFDRMMRDERDLRMLAKRLQKDSKAGALPVSGIAGVLLDTGSADQAKANVFVHDPNNVTSETWKTNNG